MEPIEKKSQKNDQFGIITKSWAGLCHHCGICAYANKKRGSSFEKLMRWHRTWCPGWAGHSKVYGVKNLLAKIIIIDNHSKMVSNYSYIPVLY